MLGLVMGGFLLFFVLDEAEDGDFDQGVLKFLQGLKMTPEVPT